MATNDVLIVDGKSATFNGEIVNIHKLASLGQGRCLYTGSDCLQVRARIPRLRF